MPTVLIADDHPIVRKGLADVIAQQGDLQLVGQASTGKEAVDLFTRLRPDVTLLDLRMPEMTGLEAIIAIRAIQPDARILILTTFDTEMDVTHVLEAGACGYLLKDAPLEQLLDTIRLAHTDPAAVRARVPRRVGRSVPSYGLTDREHDVLREMAQGKSNKQIAASLNISESTVKVHVNSILRKLDVNSRTEAVTHALKKGIVHL